MRVSVCLALSFAMTGSCLAADREQSRLAARRSPVVEVFEAARDAVVNISCRETVTVRDPIGDLFQDLFESPFGGSRRSPQGRQFTRTSVGSGFVIHPDGYIVTNAHVIAQTADRKATFVDGREYDAGVVAFDTQRDLAVLKIKTDQPLHTLPMGRSDDLMIGETVIAIGNPLGYQNTVTAGVVSAVNRDLVFSQEMKLSGLIQTDASINPGNSGGPLLNVLGELIGVNSAIRGDAQNIGFAIPVDQLREVLPDLLDVERRYRIVCGLSVDALNSPKVTEVTPGSPAQQAGVKVGDVLKAVDGHPIKQGIDFHIALMNCRPDQEVQLQIERDGKPAQVAMTIQARPAPDGVKLAMERLGIVEDDLDPREAEELGLPDAAGLRITQVQRGGPAERLLRRNDLLIAIGRHALASKDELGQLLEQVQTGQPVPVMILRADGWSMQRWYAELKAR